MIRRTQVAGSEGADMVVMERVLWVGCTALALSACDYRHVEPRRPAATETRDVSNFEAIELDGDARLEITVGESAALVMRGAPSVIKRTETAVSGNTLRIQVQRADWSWGKDRQRLIVQIQVPQLRSLQLDGGNDVRLRGFNGGESSINIQGAARIRASGTLDQLTVHVQGAGHADLSRLVTQDAKVTVDGVGSVYVHPEQSLDATMNGIGAIFYSGEPSQVSSAINGLGTISRRDADDDDGRRSQWREWHREDSDRERSRWREWRERRRDSQEDSKELESETL